MDANLELQKLRYRLLAAGYETDEVNGICSAIATEMSGQIANAVADSLQQAEQLGMDMGAQDFVAELQAVRVGDTFMVTTDSGRTDWSEPPFPMLPHLLKNAKTAKDGSRYKRIPISEKSDTKQPATTSYAAVQDRQAQLDASREMLDDDLAISFQNPDVFHPAQTFANAYKMTRVPKKDKARDKKTAGPTTEIRTASSKQNPATQWVLPPKDYDMSGNLANINANLQSMIDEIIRQAINKYGV